MNRPLPSRPQDEIRLLRRFPRQLAALLAGFALAFAVTVGAYAVAERRRTEAAQRSALASEAALLAEHVALTFKEADQALEYLAEGLARDGWPGAARSGTLHDLTRRAAGPFAQIGSVFVVDAAGRLVAISNGMPAGADLSDREYFTIHRDRSRGVLHVAAPLRSRVSGQWRFFLTRRLDGTGGTFAGVAGVALDPSFYDRLYRSLRLLEGKRIALRREDGVILVQTPSEAAAGEAPGGEDAERFQADARVPGYPAVASVSMPAARVLAAWRGRVAWQGGAAALLFAVIGGLALGLVRGVRRLEASLSEKARLEEAVIRASRLESLRVLAGGIAHDFNNLLAGVLANVEVARETTGGDRDTAEALDDAAAAARVAATLARQLLAFSRGGAPVRESVALAEIVEQSARFVLHGSACRLALHLAPELWPAEVDAGQIGQVVQNLVLNASQAMGPEGGTIRVSARNRQVDEVDAAAAGVAAGAYVELAVADEGPGIAPELAARVFEPFFTTKAGGNGLGLATVEVIVRNHGGAVMVASELGHGATFRLLLPAAAGPPSAAVAPAAATAVPSGLRVLVVEDEPLLRSGALRMLARLGCEGVGCADGRDALERVRAARSAGWRFDAALVDVTMTGGMGGAELLEALRELDASIRVILSSGYGEAVLGGPLATTGAAGFLAKPYTLEQLRSALVVAVDPRVGGRGTG